MCVGLKVKVADIENGMIETAKIFSGSIPSFSAIYVFPRAPNICCGDLAVDRFGT